MGCRNCYRSFENIVMGLYELEVLDKDSLSVIMEAYSGMDIDFGGHYNEKDLVKTGHITNAREIVLNIFGEPTPDLPENPTDEDWDTYTDKVWGKFFKITKKFNW